MDLSHEELAALQLAAERGQVTPDQAVALTLAQAAADGLFWLRHVKTRDESDPLQSTKPFPLHLKYVRELWTILRDSQRVVIAKSRQMFVSWEVAAFVLHTARFKPNQAIYWQAQQWDEAVEKVCMPTGGFMGRCQFMEKNLPDWMRLPVKESEGRLQYPNGSIIQALAGGADKARGKTFSIYVGDEFAHQEDQSGVFMTIAPLLQKGAKGIFISTPNGTSNEFATIYHGREVGTETV
jgi:phage FluMu gp28-like protein